MHRKVCMILISSGIYKEMAYEFIRSSLITFSEDIVLGQLLYSTFICFIWLADSD